MLRRALSLASLLFLSACIPPGMFSGAGIPTLPTPDPFPTPPSYSRVVETSDATDMALPTKGKLTVVLVNRFKVSAAMAWATALIHGHKVHCVADEFSPHSENLEIDGTPGHSQTVSAFVPPLCERGEANFYWVAANAPVPLSLMQTCALEVRYLQAEHRLRLHVAEPVRHKKNWTDCHLRVESGVVYFYYNSVYSGEGGI